MEKWSNISLSPSCIAGSDGPWFRGSVNTGITCVLSSDFFFFEFFEFCVFSTSGLMVLGSVIGDFTEFWIFSSFGVMDDGVVVFGWISVFCCLFRMASFIWSAMDCVSVYWGIR